ncbi:MAG: ribonuclease E/G [Rhodobacteraceae bacterium]|nr:ribonuclease E/G [Paracoccaceae bacterium]
MKGISILIDRAQGRELAAMMVDGKLVDLLVDPVASDSPQPDAIYRAVVDRPIKGMHGAIVKLGNGQQGFLKDAKGLAPGASILVQVATFAEGSKAQPVTQRLLFKSRYLILTPGAPGINVARSIRDDDERVRLLEISHAIWPESADNMGLIVRSACVGVSDDEISDDLTRMLDIATNVLADTSGPAELLLDAPSAGYRAWRDWAPSEPHDIIDQDGCFDDHGVWDAIEQFKSPLAGLTGGAYMYVEPTHALVSVDVNTGPDFSPAAALKANIAAVRELPRQLLLRGLGGQIIVDFAPLAKKDRRQIEQVVKSAFKKDAIDTTLVGWTPLGHLELLRKRSRQPLDMRS